MEEKDNDIVPIQFKVIRRLRRDFKNKCKNEGYNASAWLRVQIEKFLKEDKK